MSAFEVITSKETTPKEIEQLTKQRDELFEELTTAPAVAEALTLLEELPPDLVYHVKEHTNDVIKETILFALKDEIPRNEIEQQVIAAAWHDIGYIEQKQTNELIAATKFENSIASATIDAEIRAEIIANILDTEISFIDGVPKQKMRHSAVGYVLDADVSNFGRVDFFECMEKIAKETGKDLHKIEDRIAMYGFVIKLLENHDWHTAGARALRESQKQKNLAFLKSEYEQLTRLAA